MEDRDVGRRKFLGNMALLAAGGAVVGSRPLAAAVKGADEYRLPEYACAQDYRSLKQSSFDRTGGTHFVANRTRRDERGLQFRGTGRDHSHLVHDRG